MVNTLQKYNALIVPILLFIEVCNLVFLTNEQNWPMKGIISVTNSNSQPPVREQWIFKTKAY